MRGLNGVYLSEQLRHPPLEEKSPNRHPRIDTLMVVLKWSFGPFYGLIVNIKVFL